MTLRIYSVLGREVAELANESFGTGVYVATWDGRNRSGVRVPTGLYLYRITAGSFATTRQMLLVK